MKRNLKVRFFISAVILVAVAAFFGGMNAGDQPSVRHPQFVQACPDPVEVKQADGSVITVQMFGDEVIHYTRTLDGYTLLQDELDMYYYAEKNIDGDMVISPIRANDPGKRSVSEERFLKSLGMNIAYSEKQKKELKAKMTKNARQYNLDSANFGPIDNAFPSTGVRKMLVILAAFSDKAFIKTNNDFNAIMNTNARSFRQYYTDNSYNQLTVNTTVVGPYTINVKMRNADTNTRDFIARAVDAANNAGVDFSQFDNDGNGEMDALYVIHAGYGEEAGAPKTTIWSHSWDLGTYVRNYDGVRIFSYATSPELRNATGTTITSIGVIAHEFGHNIGVPDYYDTDGTGSGGSAWDLKKWDVMAGGSWNNSGDTPAQHNMYTKWKLGWSNPVLVNAASSLSLVNTSDSNSAYRINTATNNEFFILENRQLVNWDAYIPGHGLFIFHVDGVMIDSLAGNTVNANPSHQGLDIEEADNLRTTADYAGDPFPGSANKTSFTDTTTPNAKSWAGANTNKPITNIREVSGTVYFDVMGGAAASETTVPVKKSTLDKNRK